MRSLARRAGSLLIAAPIRFNDAVRILKQAIGFGPVEARASTLSRSLLLTTLTKPEGAAQRSTRKLAAVARVSDTTIHRIWTARGLKPHRVKRFKVSRDPKFAEKLEDIVGLYMSPPKHALVLCYDEKSQVQAPDLS